MIRYDCEQGSVDWSMLRMGIPTASCFDRILTPGGKPSKQAEEYLRHLIYESFLGGPIDAPKTSWMERGMDMEGEAVCFYEFERDVAVEQIGFITNDAATIGCSPDRLIGDDGMLEIKCPAPQTHIGYLLYAAVDKDYHSQLQGQLWIAERAWVDICSYHPALPPVIVRVERNEEYIGKLAAALAEFTEQLAAEKARLVELGYKLKDSRRVEAMEKCRRKEETHGKTEATCGVGSDGV